MRNNPMDYAKLVDLTMSRIHDEIGSRKWSLQDALGFYKKLGEAVDRQIEQTRLEMADEKTLFICVDDYQDTYFHIGDTMTAEGWKEWALSMNDMDECENREEFAKLPPKEAIQYIADMWQIEIVVFDPLNKEHVNLHNQWVNNK